jgi:LCP family protein required for cell wall assembly
MAGGLVATGLVGMPAARTMLARIAVDRVTAGLARNSVLASDLDPVARGKPVVYLLVGSDRRHGLPPGFGLGGDVLDRRADTVVLYAVPSTSGSVRVLSVPRDLRVQVPGHGGQKLAGAYQYGSRPLLAAVRAGTGVEVNHYVEVDFAGLTGVVDLLGGIDLDLPFPARDTVSGLRLNAGRQWLSGRMALAFVRSRTYQELRGGRWIYVNADDLGRIDRQQRFMAALLTAARSRVDIGLLRRAATATGQHINVDAAFGSSDVRRWLAVLGAPERRLAVRTLPTRPAVPVAEAASPFPPEHAGSVGYLVRQEPQATEAAAQFTASHEAG